MATSELSRTGTQYRDPIIYLSTELIRAKEYLEAIVSSTSDAICTTDLTGKLIYVSPGAERMLGRSFHELMGRPVSRIYAGGRKESERVMKILLARGSIADYETAFVTSENKRVPVSMSASLIRDRHGKLIGTLGISKDISRRVELERRLRHLSITDELTGLFNKRCFRDRLKREIQRTKRQGEKLSLLLIDLDHFKDANDRWGHLEGDRILKETSEVIADSIRKDVDAAFRVGGDEFTAILPGLGHRHAAAVARRINECSLKCDFAHLVRPSIGIASLRENDTIDSLIKRADAAMYRSKRRRKA